ncbi:MAG: DNA polymerase III subunit delta [Ruminiclostridium sp.]|nr:DNA polymerase III subunit delta [Ruminiclostridium sp.]
MSMDVLKRHMKENKIGKLYLFTGPEQYLVRYYTDQILEKLLDENTKVFNYSELTGKVSFQAISDVVSIYPAFADRRVVLIKESTLFKQGGKETDWNAFFSSLPEYICLIFIQQEVDKRLIFYKALDKNGLIVDFKRQDEKALIKWVINRFSRFRKQINEQDAAYLVTLLDPDMSFMSLELEKIARYAGETERITRKHIDAVASRSVKSIIFDLTDAISQRQTTQALKILSELVEQKEPIPLIMAMVGRQMGVLLRLKKMEEKKLSQPEMAKLLGMNPYVVGKIRRQAASFTIDQLKQTMRKCVEMDQASKSGRMDPRMALDVFITELGLR